MRLLKIKLLTIAAALLLAASHSHAANFSFTGNFVNDNDVQLFSFTVDATSTVTLRSWSYAGGVNAAGQTIARGGFDPILALFNSTGDLVGQDDDGPVGPVELAGVSVDLSGAAYDTLFTVVDLAPGTYTASIMQYNNFAVGPNISNGFVRDGQLNFTPSLAGELPGYFWDVSESELYEHRDGHWAFDILNVADAVVPEPSTYLAGALLALMFGVQGVRSLHNRKQTA